MPAVLRTFFFGTLIALGVFMGGAAVFAQEDDDGGGTLSPYQPLRCQNMRDGSVTCTYPSGQTAPSCTTSTVGGGTTTRYECTNPDTTRTVCDRSATGDLDGRTAGTQTVCTVYDTEGNVVTERDTTNSEGRTRGGVTDSGGNETEINVSNMQPGETCGPFSLDACIRAIPGLLFVGIGFIFLTLSGIILFLAGTVFNWVVLRTVFQFGEYFGTSDGMLVAWGVMRDIANIGLLFAFIFMGVLLILNVEGGGHGHHGGISAKRAIPQLILFAVLLNFSLFATQFVVDIANAFGSSFTTLAGQQECSEAVTGTDGNPTGSMTLEDCATNIGISGKIIQAAGLTNIFGDNRGDLQAILSNLAGRPYSYAVSLIMLSIFVLVTAFVLLAGAIMLAVRVVILSFLMVTSPIGFAGMVIPGLHSIAGKWWSMLISQSFFAPVYLLLIFISIKLTEGLMNGQASLTNALIADQGNAISGNMQVVMVYFIVIGFMIASTITASKMGAMGASFATKSAAAVTLGSAGFVGRRTLGAASGAVAKNIAKSSWARNNGIGSRLAYNVASKGAASSYSLRTGLNSATGAMGVDTGMGNASKDVSHGLHGIEEKEVKARQKFADDVIAQNSQEAAKEKSLKDEKKKLQEQGARENFLWNEKKKLQESEVETQKAVHATAAATREAAIKEQKAKVDEAASGYPDPATLEAETEALAGLEKQHKEALAAEAQDIENRSKAILDQQRTHVQNLASYDKRSKQIDREISGGEFYDAETGKTIKIKGVSQDAARRQYAEKLQHSGLPYPSVGKHVNHEAAEKILKKLNRSDQQKLMDALKDATKKDSGGGAAPAAAAPKKGGGGGGGDAH